MAPRIALDVDADPWYTVGVSVLSLVLAFVLFTCLPLLAAPLHSQQAASATARLEEAGQKVSRARMSDVAEECRRYLSDVLGMRITLDVTCRYEPLDRIQIAAGDDTRGYTTFRVDGDRVEATIHAPLGTRLDVLIHVFTHEFTHVWQFEQHLGNDRTLREGLGEFAAWHHLETRGFTHEMAVIEHNEIEEYAAGFRNLQTLCARLGPRETVARIAQR